MLLQLPAAASPEPHPVTSFHPPPLGTAPRPPRRTLRLCPHSAAPRHHPAQPAPAPTPQKQLCQALGKTSLPGTGVTAPTTLPAASSARRWAPPATPRAAQRRARGDAAAPSPAYLWRPRRRVRAGGSTESLEGKDQKQTLVSNHTLRKEYISLETSQCILLI